jgi:hypothetical protein
VVREEHLLGGQQPRKPRIRAQKAAVVKVDDTGLVATQNLSDPRHDAQVEALKIPHELHGKTGQGEKSPHVLRRRGHETDHATPTVAGELDRQLSSVCLGASDAEWLHTEDGQYHRFGYERAFPSVRFNLAWTRARRSLK